ncbi:MAG: methyltransferase domain-containing protein [Chitinophagaceae bacterium]|nr:methyltransferase domain-containing protein [Chitinophagaceae bacterium]
MKESKYYTKSFFKNHLDDPYISAKEFVPLIYNTFKPVSVVDFGCGVGNWLKVWQEETPVKKLLGIEGPYIKKEFFKVPSEIILLKDLKEEIDLGEKFDIVISLEVAEHLPDADADRFVSNLVKAGDVIVFSAAITGQLGTYHINEQYPEYWAMRFKKYNYVPVDYFRPAIWNNEKIEYWYRQNTLLFIKESELSKYPTLLPYYHTTNPNCLLRIHPIQYELKLDLIQRTSTFLGFIHWKLYLLKLSFKNMFNKA